MNTRKHAWLAMLVLAGLLAPPSPAEAMRKPSRLQEEVTMEHDPWRPDANDPGRALASRGESVIDERSAAPPVREPAIRSSWYRVLLRMLRHRLFWGGVR